MDWSFFLFLNDKSIALVKAATAMTGQAMTDAGIDTAKSNARFKRLRLAR
jgi:hypothetical protein